MKLGSILKTVIENAGDFLDKNGRIVAGIGAGLGVIVTAVLAYQARPKVDKIVASKKEKILEIEKDEAKNPEEKEAEIKEATKECIKEVAVALGATALSAATTAALVTEVIVSGEKRINVLSEFASVGNIAYQNIDGSARELLDDKQYEALKKNEFGKMLSGKEGYRLLGPSGYYDTGKGNIKYYDAISGRPFLCSEEAIIAAVNETNIEFAKIPDGKKKVITYEKLYKRIGLPGTTATAYIFWDEPIEINIMNSTNWGQGSLRVLDYMVRPKVGIPPK